MGVALGLLAGCATFALFKFGNQLCSKPPPAALPGANVGPTHEQVARIRAQAISRRQAVGLSQDFTFVVEG